MKHSGTAEIKKKKKRREEENRQEACSLGSYALRLVRLGVCVCVQMFGAGLSVKS